MKIIKEKFKTDQKNRLYWGRVYFISDNREWKTKILWAASFEWVRRQLMLDAWKEADVEKLLNKYIVKKWKDAGRKVFSHSVQYDGWGANEKETIDLKEYSRMRAEQDRNG